MQTYTTILIALWGNSVTTGKPRAHTRIDLLGNIPVDQAVTKAKEIVTDRYDYWNTKQYLLNCIDAGNFSVVHNGLV